MYNRLGVWGYIYTASCVTRDCLQNQVLRRQSCPYLSPVPRGVFPFKRATAGGSHRLSFPAQFCRLNPACARESTCYRRNCGPHLDEALPPAKMAGATRYPCCRCCCLLLLLLLLLLPSLLPLLYETLPALHSMPPRSRRSRLGPTAARAGCLRTSTAAAVNRQKDLQEPVAVREVEVWAAACS